MISRRRDKTGEHVRNFFLIILAVAGVFIFFNLDIIRKGESVFSKTADKKLNFTGQLKQNDYTAAEVKRLLAFIRRYDSRITGLTIQASAQDSYGKITATTEVLFEIKMVMRDGAEIAAPVRRAPRKTLVTAILEKLNKDMRAYNRLKKQGKKVDSLINTM